MNIFHGLEYCMSFAVLNDSYRVPFFVRDCANYLSSRRGSAENVLNACEFISAISKEESDITRGKTEASAVL